MVQINFARKEINCKLVYYGPGVSGKTTNLEMVHQRTPDANKGELTSISTDGDRTLFFDFMPLDLGEIAGMKTKFHLYTVPGQVYYNSTRKLVLLGADGVIFVADSSRSKLEENRESLDNLRENLAGMGKDLAKFPIVIQWNKRDLEDAMPVEELERELNPTGAPSFEGVANKGEGVFDTLKALSAKVLASINSSQPVKRSAAIEEEPPRSEDLGKDEEIGAVVAQDAVPPPVGGFQIERNEADSTNPGHVAAPAAPAVTVSRPQVASNPLEEMGVIAAQAQPASKSATLERPPSPDEARPAQPNPSAESHSEVSELMARRAQPAPPAEREVESFRREVKVIGGRPGGGFDRHQGGRAVVVSVACAASLMAAAAIIYYLFVV